MGMLSFTSLTLFPTLLHDLRGYPNEVIGMLIAARGIGNWVAFLVIVQFSRMAPRLAIATGLALQAASAFWMAQLDINMTDADVFWSNLLQGFGQSITFTPMTVMAFSTLPPQQATEGSAVFTLMRNFGSSLFISIAVLVLLRSTSTNYARLTEMITPYNETLVFPGLPSAWGLDSTTGLLRLSGELHRQASMIGYVNAFQLMAITALLAVPLAFLMKRPAA
jgi:DHA2 family multidrug resistance protein